MYVHPPPAIHRDATVYIVGTSERAGQQAAPWLAPASGAEVDSVDAEAHEEVVKAHIRDGEGEGETCTSTMS